MVTPLNRIIIFVADVQRCARFYRDAFGFKDSAGGDPSSPEWVELDTGGCRLALHRAFAPTGRPVDAPTGGPGNPHKIVFHADDVPAARATLLARGAEMGQLRTSGNSVRCDGHDPEGHVFQISNQP